MNHCDTSYLMFRSSLVLSMLCNKQGSRQRVVHGFEPAFSCSESVAQNQHEAIQGFIQGTIAEKAPVVPISAQLKYNVDAVCEYIVRRIPVPVRDFTSPPQMIVIRSFDVNKPGSEVEDLQGGVAGGSILQVIYDSYTFLLVSSVVAQITPCSHNTCTPSAQCNPPVTSP